jgi:hypothetical protein
MGDSAALSFRKFVRVRGAEECVGDNELEGHSVMDERRMLGVILAGLRLLQSHGTTEPVEDIATNGGMYPLPTQEELDDLCVELNCKAVSLVRKLEDAA